MVVYLYPKANEASAQDLDRLKREGAEPVNAIELATYGYKSVRDVVRKISRFGVRMLVLPDDYHRHTEPIEHVKACAYHMGLPVMPLTRYLTTLKAAAPSPTTSLGARQPETGEGGRAAVPAAAG